MMNPLGRRFSRISIILCLFFAILVVDQVTKALAREWLAFTEPSEFLNGMIRIEYAQNTGAFLSLGANLGEGVRTIILIIAVAIFLLWAGWTLIRRRNMDWFSTYGLTLLLAGGVGNLIDRIVFGHVTDFLNMGFGNLRTGIFNVADVAIVIGVPLLIFSKSGGDLFSAEVRSPSEPS